MIENLFNDRGQFGSHRSIPLFKPLSAKLPLLPLPSSIETPFSKQIFPRARRYWPAWSDQHFSFPKTNALRDYQKVYFLIIAIPRQEIAYKHSEDKNTTPKRAVFPWWITLSLPYYLHISFFASGALKIVAYRNILLYNRDRKDSYQKVHFLIAVFYMVLGPLPFTNRAEPPESFIKWRHNSDNSNRNAAACNP